MNETRPEHLGTKHKIGLRDALATNILNMVGVGPFITIPLILGAMGGPQAMLGWVFGAGISICDGLVWAELGAAMPGSGGSYLYLLEAYGPATFGRLMSFLFLSLSVIATPLLTASGAVGFAEYSRVLFPHALPWQLTATAVCVCLVSTILLYRNIKSIGRFALILAVLLAATMGWIIATGITHFQQASAFTFPPGAFHLSPAFFRGLGAAVLFAMYDYQGYFTVCLIGDEVRTPERTMPRSILISILVLAACYLAMSYSVIGVVPWREAMHSSSVVADVMVRVYGPLAGQITAILIMIAAFGSVFTVLLGFSRVPFAAAVRGEFFSIFARVHPKGFPSFAVVSLGLASAVACLLPLERLISALLVIQILSQFLAQCVAVVLIRRCRKDIARPFSMYLYPLPVFVAIAGWLLILSSSQFPYILAGVLSLLAGVAAFLVKSRNKREWPFHSRALKSAVR